MIRDTARPTNARPGPFQFSMRELLVGVLSCGAMAAVFSYMLEAVEDKAEVGRAIGVSVAAFALGAFIVSLGTRGGWRVMFVATIGYGAHFQEDLIDQQIENNAGTAVMSCYQIASAQNELAAGDYTGVEPGTYAQTLQGLLNVVDKSSGLAQKSNLIVKELADAEAAPGPAKPHKGYCFKILKKKGRYAPGGAGSYLKNGTMQNGFAILAYPAKYGVTGRHSYMVSDYGTYYYRDLYSATLEVVGKMDEFDPSPDWTVLK